MQHKYLDGMKMREDHARKKILEHMKLRDEALLAGKLDTAQEHHLKYQEYNQEAALWSNLQARFVYLHKG